MVFVFVSFYENTSLFLLNNCKESPDKRFICIDNNPGCNVIVLNAFFTTAYVIVS